MSNQEQKCTPTIMIWRQLGFATLKWEDGEVTYIPVPQGATIRIVGKDPPKEPKIKNIPNCS